LSLSFPESFTRFSAPLRFESVLRLGVLVPYNGRAMLQSVVLASGLAFAAVVQPGPLQAFLFSKVLATGWRRTLPAALAPVLSDGPIAALALLVVRRVPPSFESGLRGAGGLFLLWLGWGAFREAREGRRPEEGNDRAPRTLVRAVVINLLNPNPYIAWALVIGPAVVAAWGRSHGEAVALVAAFYGTMVAGLAGFIAVCGNAHQLGGRALRALALAAAGALVALGAWQVIVALAGFVKPV
jgi:threonine/homoserine/homoserine lactone efflux protein